MKEQPNRVKNKSKKIKMTKEQHAIVFGPCTYIKKNTALQRNNQQETSVINYAIKCYAILWGADARKHGWEKKTRLINNQ